MTIADATRTAVSAGGPSLPGGLRNNPRLGRWLRVSREGTVEVFTGKVELGQGILTALAQIVAEEMDLRLDQVCMRPVSTDASPDEGVTSGSLSIQESGAALRHAGAEARSLYIEAAAALLHVPADRLTVTEGSIHGPDGATTSYWALADDMRLDRDASAGLPTKPAAAYRVVGKPSLRIDLPDKVFGAPRFIQDLALPGLLHGRMMRPPSPGATLLSLDDARAAVMDGVVAVHRDGSLVGLLAQTGRQAERALVVLRQGAVWSEGSRLPDAADLPAWLLAQPVDGGVVSVREPPHDRLLPARTVQARYAKPFLAHASVAPSCALARANDGRLEVWTHSQGPFNLRADLALALRMEPNAIVVRHVESAGCYGHNGADDVAFDAAWLARYAAGCPVRVAWSRADDLAQAPFGPAMTVDLAADLAPDGSVLGWRHTVWSNGHSTRPGRAASPALLGAWAMAVPFDRLPAINAPLTAGGGAERNAVPSYDFPAWHIESHRVLTMPLRTSAMRALGALANVFAAESFMDELALSIDRDPVEYRLAHLADPRGRRVIALAAERAGWERFRPRDGIGIGIGYARYKTTGAYCAVVAEIEAGREIRVVRLTIAVDVGMAVNPDGVVNQIEGGAIQATSWTLKEAVQFDATHVTSDSWDGYPILRFADVPAVAVHIVSSDQPSVGAGEGSVGPTAAAIANAVANALGVRVREMPLTTDRILAAG